MGEHCPACKRFIPKFDDKDAEIIITALKPVLYVGDLKIQQAIQRAVSHLNDFLKEAGLPILIFTPCPDCGDDCVDTGGTSCGGGS